MFGLEVWERIVQIGHHLNYVLCLVEVLQYIVLQGILELVESDTLVKYFSNKSEDGI